MNFLVVVSVPFTTKNLLLLKGELLKNADACIKYLTLAKVFSKFNSVGFFFFSPKLFEIQSYTIRCDCQTQPFAVAIFLTKPLFKVH